jgi:hypothetical protein
MNRFDFEAHMRAGERCRSLRLPPGVWALLSSRASMLAQSPTERASPRRPSSPLFLHLPIPPRREQSWRA